MIFTPLPLQGAYLIDLEPREDERGTFARAFCRKEFEDHGLAVDFVQCNLSSNAKAGTVRGIHYQRPPHAEIKLVRCVRGTVFDVIVDMRGGSPTFVQWYGAELSEKNGSMMYVPEGFAHGYQALTAGGTVFYMVSAFHAPGAEAGVRYDDPSIGVRWPLPAGHVSEKDRGWPLFNNATVNEEFRDAEDSVIPSIDRPTE